MVYDQIIQLAKNTATLMKRPYVCEDMLWYSLLISESGAVECIMSSVGLNKNMLALVAYTFLIEKKESTKPSNRFNLKVNEVIKFLEEIKTQIKEPLSSPELLILAILTCPDKKDSKFEKFLFEQADKSELVKNTIDFLNDSTEIDALLHQYLHLEEGEEEEYYVELETFDPFEENEILEEFSTNLNKKAYEGDFDSIIPIEKKIEELSTVLCRNKKPNAILVGRAGTGKTALVESFAKKILDGEVGEKLSDKVILEVDLAAMVAGTEYRGMFEKRIKKFLEEVQKYDNIILFFDEIHTLIGAGGTGKTGDLEASNIIKPMLARGEISVIGATTDYEFNTKFKKDPALIRRFEKIDIFPMTEEHAAAILPDLCSKYENVDFTKDFKQAIIPVCEKYLPNRVFPDKLVDVLDHCSAMAEVRNSTKVNKKLLLEFVKNKSGLVGNLNQSNLLLKEAEPFLKKEDQKRLIETIGKKENVLCFFGLEDEISKFSKALVKKLKTENSNIISVSGNTLNREMDIIGFTDTYLHSLAQKVSALDGSTVVLNASHKISGEVTSLLSEILSEGEIQMKNGETVSFSNTTFLIFTKQKYNSVGFGESQSFLADLPFKVKNQFFLQKKDLISKQKSDTISI